jgi:hypothetical protein
MESSSGGGGVVVEVVVVDVVLVVVSGGLGAASLPLPEHPAATISIPRAVPVTTSGRRRTAPR